MRFKIPGSILIVLILSSLLAACASPIVATELDHHTETPLPIPTDKPPRATSTPESTLTITPIPLIEPVLPALSSPDVLPVNPPDFNAKEELEPVLFDLSAAHAVYAWYRQKEGPAMWTSDAAFISDMAEYADILEAQGIELKQATFEGLTYSLLTRGKEILLNVDADGTFNDGAPGRWSKDSTPEWIDVGSQAELFIGEDGHAYIAKVDNEGNVTAFQNTIGATKDNLDGQWIEVVDGSPNAVWNGKEWTTEVPTLVTAGYTINNREANGFGTMTLDEINSFETTLTMADLRDPELGAIAKRDENDTVSAFVIGEIVGFRTGSYILYEGGGRADFTEIVVDIPDSSETGVVRIYRMIEAGHFGAGLMDVQALQENIQSLTDSGIDSMTGLTLKAIVNGNSDTFINYPPTDTERHANFISKDLIGQRFGFLMPGLGRRIIPGEVILGEQIPNQVFELLLGTRTEVDPNFLDIGYFGTLMLAVPRELVN